MPRPRPPSAPRRPKAGLARFAPSRSALFTACAVAFAVVARSAPDLLPFVTTALFLAVGSAVMRPWYLLLDAVLVGAAVTVVLRLTGQPPWSELSTGLVMIGTIALGWLLRRDRIGLVQRIGGAAAADEMLIDLQNRVLLRSALPVLPTGWQLDADLRSAHGESFSGDFVVSSAPTQGWLEVVLVDVSGKGQRAGGRALLLAAALEALLDAVPREAFLPAANEHVIRHGDDDGFATAVRVSVDLDTGAFVLSGAGHPPAAHYRAGSGRWVVIEDDQGPALGLLAGAGYPTFSGLLGRGDALLLYTDGLVENRRLDVGQGIDRLIGHADALLARGVDRAAARIAEANRAEEGDDRALVVIRRT